MSKQEDATLGLSVDITVDTESVSEITTETVGVIEATFKGISLAIKNGLQNVTATTNKSIADLHTQLMQQSTTIAKTATETKALMATGPLNFGGLDTRISELTAKLGQLTTGIANFSASMPTEPIRNLPNEDARALTNNSHALEQILVSIQKAVPNMLTAVSKTRAAETPKDELFNAVKNITTATMELQKELKQIPVALATNKMSMAVRPLQQSIIHYEANETELRSIVSRILDSTSKTVTEANKELLRSLMGTYGHNVQEVIVRFTDALAVEALKTLNSTAKKAEDQLTTCFKTTDKLLNTMGTIALAITQKGDIVAGSNYRLKYYNEDALVARNSDVKTVLQTVHTSITNPEVKVSTQDIVVRAIDAQTKEYTKCLRTELAAMGKELGATFKDSYELCKACGGGNKYHGETTVLTDMLYKKLMAYGATMIVAGHKLSCDGCLAEMKKAGVQNAIAVVDPYMGNKGQLQAKATSLELSISKTSGKELETLQKDLQGIKTILASMPTDALDSVFPAAKWIAKSYLINKMQYELLDLVKTLENVDLTKLFSINLPTEKLLTQFRAAKNQAQAEGLVDGVFQVKIDHKSIGHIAKQFAVSFGEHVTLSFGQQLKDIEKTLLGKEVPIKIKGIASNEKIQALVVELPPGIESKNAVPHITLSAAPGVKPFESNAMLKGEHKFTPIEDYNSTIQGIVEFKSHSPKPEDIAKFIQLDPKQYYANAQLNPFGHLGPHGGGIGIPLIERRSLDTKKYDLLQTKLAELAYGSKVKIDRDSTTFNITLLDKSDKAIGNALASNTTHLGVWHATTEIAKDYSGKGLGKALYLAVLEEIKAIQGNKPYLFLPEVVQGGRGTSPSALRVWESNDFQTSVASMGNNIFKANGIGTSKSYPVISNMEYKEANELLSSVYKNWNQKFMAMADVYKYSLESTPLLTSSTHLTEPRSLEQASWDKIRQETINEVDKALQSNGHIRSISTTTAARGIQTLASEYDQLSSSHQQKVLQQLETLQTKLKPNGLMVGYDYSIKPLGSVTAPSVLKAEREAIAKDFKYRRAADEVTGAEIKVDILDKQGQSRGFVAARPVDSGTKSIWYIDLSELAAEFQGFGAGKEAYAETIRQIKLEMKGKPFTLMPGALAGADTSEKASRIWHSKGLAEKLAPEGISFIPYRNEDDTNGLKVASTKGAEETAKLINSYLQKTDLPTVQFKPHKLTYDMDELVKNAKTQIDDFYNITNGLNPTILVDFKGRGSAEKGLTAKTDELEDRVKKFKTTTAGEVDVVVNYKLKKLTDETSLSLLPNTMLDLTAMPSKGILPYLANGVARTTDSNYLSYSIDSLKALINTAIGETSYITAAIARFEKFHKETLVAKNAINRSVPINMLSTTQLSRNLAGAAIDDETYQATDSEDKYRELINITSDIASIKKDLRKSKKLDDPLANNFLNTQIDKQKALQAELKIPDDRLKELGSILDMEDSSIERIIEQTSGVATEFVPDFSKFKLLGSNPEAAALVLQNNRALNIAGNNLRTLKQTLNELRIATPTGLKNAIEEFIKSYNVIAIAVNSINSVIEQLGLNINYTNIVTSDTAAVLNKALATTQSLEFFEKNVAITKRVKKEPKTKDALIDELKNAPKQADRSHLAKIGMQASAATGLLGVDIETFSNKQIASIGIVGDKEVLYITRKDIQGIFDAWHGIYLADDLLRPKQAAKAVGATHIQTTNYADFLVTSIKALKRNIEGKQLAHYAGADIDIIRAELTRLIAINAFPEANNELEKALETMNFIQLKPPVDIYTTKVIQMFERLLKDSKYNTANLKGLEGMWRIVAAKHPAIADTKGHMPVDDAIRALLTDDFLATPDSALRALVSEATINGPIEKREYRPEFKAALDAVLNSPVYRVTKLLTERSTIDKDNPRILVIDNLVNKLYNKYIEVQDLLDAPDSTKLQSIFTSIPMLENGFDPKGIQLNLHTSIPITEIENAKRSSQQLSLLVKSLAVSIANITGDNSLDTIIKALPTTRIENLVATIPKASAITGYEGLNFRTDLAKDIQTLGRDLGPETYVNLIYTKLIKLAGTSDFSSFRGSNAVIDNLNARLAMPKTGEISGAILSAPYDKIGENLSNTKLHLAQAEAFIEFLEYLRNTVTLQKTLPEDKAVGAYKAVSLAIEKDSKQDLYNAIEDLTSLGVTAEKLDEMFKHFKPTLAPFSQALGRQGGTGEVAANLDMANTEGLEVTGKKSVISGGSGLEGGVGVVIKSKQINGQDGMTLIGRPDSLLYDAILRLIYVLDVKTHKSLSAEELAQHTQTRVQLAGYSLLNLPTLIASYRDNKTHFAPYTLSKNDSLNILHDVFVRLHKAMGLLPPQFDLAVSTVGNFNTAVQNMINKQAKKTDTPVISAAEVLNNTVLNGLNANTTVKSAKAAILGSQIVEAFFEESEPYNKKTTPILDKYSQSKTIHAIAISAEDKPLRSDNPKLDRSYDAINTAFDIAKTIEPTIGRQQFVSGLAGHMFGGSEIPTIVSATTKATEIISSLLELASTKAATTIKATTTEVDNFAKHVSGTKPEMITHFKAKGSATKDFTDKTTELKANVDEFNTVLNKGATHTTSFVGSGNVPLSEFLNQGIGLLTNTVSQTAIDAEIARLKKQAEDKINATNRARKTDADRDNLKSSKAIELDINTTSTKRSSIPPDPPKNPPSSGNGTGGGDDDEPPNDKTKRDRLLAAYPESARDYRITAGILGLETATNGDSFELVKAKAKAAETEIHRLMALIADTTGAVFLDDAQKDLLAFSISVREAGTGLEALKRARADVAKGTKDLERYKSYRDIKELELADLKQSGGSAERIELVANELKDVNSRINSKVESLIGQKEIVKAAEASLAEALNGKDPKVALTNLTNQGFTLASKASADQRIQLYSSHLEDIYRTIPEQYSPAHALDNLAKERELGIGSNSRAQEIYSKEAYIKGLLKEYAKIDSVKPSNDPNRKFIAQSDAVLKDLALVKELEAQKLDLENRLKKEAKTRQNVDLTDDQLKQSNMATESLSKALELNETQLSAALNRIGKGFEKLRDEANKAKLSLAEALKQDNKDNIAKKIEDLTKATELYQAKVKAGIATPIDRVGNATNLYELAKLGQGSVETTFADLLAQENTNRRYMHSRAAGIGLTDIKAKLQTQFGYTPDSTFSSLLTDYAGIRGRSMMNLKGTSISATGDKVDGIEQNLKELQRIEKEIQDAKDNKDFKTERNMQKSWNKKLLEIDKQMGDLKTHLDAEFVISLTPKVRKELFDKAIKEALQPLQIRKQELDSDFNNNNLMSPDKYRELLSTNKKIAELQGVGYADALIASLQPAKSVTTNQTANEWLRKNNFGQFAQNTNSYQDLVSAAQPILSGYARTLNPQDSNLTALANRTNEITAAQADLDRYKLTPNLSDKDKANQKSLEDKLITLRKEAEELAKKVAADFEIAKQESLNPTSIANKHADATAELKKNLEYQRDILLAEQATLGSTNERVNKLKELNVQLAKIEGAGLADSILRTLTPVTNSTKGIQAQEWLANNFAQGGFKPQNAYQRVTTAASPILQSYANMLAQTSDSKDELSRTLNRIASRTNGVNELQKNLETYKGNLSPEDELNKSDIEAKIAKLKNKIVKDMAKLNDLFDAATDEALDPNKIRKNLNTTNTELERELKLRRDILVVEQAITGGDANRAREIANINSQLNALKGTGYANDILKGLAPTKSVTTGLTSQQWLRNNGFSQFADQMNTPYMDAFNTAKPILNNYSNLLAGQSPSQDRLSTTLTNLARYTNEITALQNRLEHPDIKGTNEEADIKKALARSQALAKAEAAKVNPLMDQALQDSLDPTKTNTRLTQQIADLTKSLEIEKQILDVEKDTGKQTAERAARLQQINEQIAIIKNMGLAAALDLQRGKTEHPLQGILGTNAAYNIAKTAGLNANGITFDRTMLAEQKQHELQKLLMTYGQFDAVIAQNTKMSRTDILMHGIAGNNAAIADYQKQLNMAEHTLLKDPGNKDALSVQQQMKAAIQERMQHQEKLWQLVGKTLQKEQETEKSLDYQVKVENDLLNVKKQQLERDLAIAKIHLVAGTGGTAQENLDKAKRIEDELNRLNKRKPITTADVDKPVNQMAKELNMTPQGESKGARGFAEQVMNMGTWWAEWTIGQQVMQVIPNALSASIGFAKEFEAIMKNVELITQANKVQFEQLVHTVAGLSNTTIFNPKELADGLVILGQAGFTAAESMKLLPNIAQLATATLSSLKTAADIATTAIEAFNIPVENSGMLTNTLAAITIESKLELESLGTTFNYIAESAAAAGLSIEQTGTAMGIMSNAGVRASTIGTSLRSILGTLMAPTEKFKAELGKVGLSVEDVNPRYRELGAILNDLRSKGFNVQEAFQGLDKRIAGAITSLIQNSENYTEFIGKITGTSRATTMAEGQMDTFDAQAKRLKNNALLLGGEAFMPALEPTKEMTRALAGIAHILTIVMNVIPQSIRSFAGFGAAVGVGAAVIKTFLEGLQLITGVKTGTGFLASFGVGMSNMKEVLAARGNGLGIKSIDAFKNAGPVHQQFLGLLANLFDWKAWVLGGGITLGMLTAFAAVRELSGQGEQERAQRKAAESEAYAQELNLYSDILSKANTSSVLYAETLDTLAKKYGILSGEALKYAVIAARIAAKEDQKQATIASAKQPISWFENLTTFAEESKQKQAKLSADAQIDLLKQAGVYYTGTDDERLAVLNSANISGNENELAKRARLLVNRTINEDMSAQDIAAKQLAEAKKNVKDLYDISQLDPQKNLAKAKDAAATYMKQYYVTEDNSSLHVNPKIGSMYETATSGITAEAQGILDSRYALKSSKLFAIDRALTNPEEDKELYEALNRTQDEIALRQKDYIEKFDFTEMGEGNSAFAAKNALAAASLQESMQRNLSKETLTKLGMYKDSTRLNKDKAAIKFAQHMKEKQGLEPKSDNYEEMEKLLAIDTQEELARKRDEKASEYFYYKGQKTGFMVSGAQGAAVKDMEKQLAKYRELEKQLTKQKAGAGTAADIDLTTEQIKDQEAALKQLAITGMKLLVTKNMDFSGFKGIPQGVIQSIEKYIGAINTGINSGGLTGTDIFRKQFENLKALSGVAASDLPELGNKIDAINTKYKQLMADSPLAGKPKKLADGTIQNMSRDNEVHLALKARWDIEIEETVEQTALAGWQRLEPKVKAITDILQQNMNSKLLNLELGLDIRKADINIAAAQHSIDYMKSSHLTTSDWGGYLSGSVNTPIILAGGKDQALEQEINRKKETDLAIATFTAAQERYRLKQQELMESYIISFATATNLPGIDEGKKRPIYNYGGLVDTDKYTEKAIATRQALLAMGDRSGIASTELVIDNIEKQKAKDIAKNKKDKVSNLTKSGLTVDQQKTYDSNLMWAQERKADAEAELEKAKTTPITYGQEKQPVDVKNKFEKLREQYLNAKEINRLNNTDESRKVLKAIEKDYLEADMAYKQPLSELKRLDSGIWARKDSSAIDVQDLMTLISSGEIGHTALTKQMDNMAFAQWDEANKARSAAQDAILAAQKRGNVSPEELATLKAAEEAARNEVEIASAKGQKILDMKRKYVDQAKAMEKELVAGISQAVQSEINIRKQAQEQIEQRKQFQATVRTDNETFQADISKRLPGYSAPNTDKRIAAMAEMFDKASASFNNGREDEGKKYYQAARSMADGLKGDQSLSEQEIQRVSKVHSEGTYAVDSIQDRLNQRTAEQTEEQSKPFRAALEKSKIELKKRVDETMEDVDSTDAEKRNTALAYRSKLAKVESYTNATGEDIMKVAQDRNFSELLNPNSSDLFGESTKKFADAVASFVEVFKTGKQPIDNEKKDPTKTTTDTADTKGTIELKIAAGTEGALTSAIVGAMSGKFIPTSDLTGLGS